MIMTSDLLTMCGYRSIRANPRRLTLPNPLSIRTVAVTMVITLSVVVCNIQCLSRLNRKEWCNIPGVKRLSRSRLSRFNLLYSSFILENRRRKLLTFNVVKKLTFLIYDVKPPNYVCFYFLSLTVAH